MADPNSDQHLLSIGMNVIACPRCQELNDLARSKKYAGNVFIPISAWKHAWMLNDHTCKFHVACHAHNHGVVVQAYASNSVV